MAQASIDCVGRDPATTSMLQVGLSQDLSPPSEDHQLLLAFHFGGGPATLDHPAIISPDLAPVDKDQVYECWWYAGDVAFREHGSVRVADCDDYSVAIYEGDENKVDGFEAFTCNAYRELLQAIELSRHKRMVKIWNYLGGINDGDDDRERYRQFSVGRAHAFQELNIRDEDSPTGTAIGTMKETGLSIIALASRHEFSLAENPRQVSAYHYPRQYGLRSPKFGRGGYLSTDDHKLYLISGTAAVVGHESAHPYDVEMQIDEIFRNLDALCEVVSKLDGHQEKLVLDDESILRVYLRNPEEMEIIAHKLQTSLGLSNQQVVFLHGNICRRELMVEIDGVKVR